MSRKKTGEFLVCALCGKEFYLKRSKILNGCGIYCSRECQRYVPENEIRIEGDIAYIKIENKSRNFVGEAVIDTCEIDKIRSFGYRWFAAWHETTSQFHAASNDKIDGKWTRVLLHRFILEAQKGMDVDHINHNMLDCRKINLRICTRGENLQNRKGAMATSKSGIRGVWFDLSRNQWTAELKVAGKKIFVGRFHTIEEAEKEVKLARSIHMTHSSECVS